MRNHRPSEVVGASLVLLFCFSAAPAAAQSKPDEIEGSVLLKTFDVDRDLPNIPTKQEFIAKLGNPKSSRFENGVEIVTWFYRRYDPTEEIGEYKSLDVRFDRSGYFLALGEIGSGTINLAAYLKIHLTPEERGVDVPPGAAPAMPARKPVTAGPSTGPRTFQRVSFDDFFAGQTKPMPLSLELPGDFVRAVGYTSFMPPGMGTPLPMSVWMRSEDVAAAITSHRLPVTAGSFLGRLPPALVAGFDPNRGRFREEEQLALQLQRMRTELLDQRRLDVNGHPMFAYLGRNQQGRIFGALSVATAGQMEIIQFLYRPTATDDLATVRTTWDHILASLH